MAARLLCSRVRTVKEANEVRYVLRGCIGGCSCSSLLWPTPANFVLLQLCA